MNTYVLYRMPDICTLIGRERSREQSDDVRMLMSHVTLKHNTPIAFLAL